MKVKRTVEVKATTKEVVVETLCDLCGKKIQSLGPSSVDEVIIQREYGNNYGQDGGAIEETSVDCCGNCFTGKVIPWLKSQGAEPQVNEREW